MGNLRRQHPPNVKVKAALEAIKGKKTRNSLLKSSTNRSVSSRWNWTHLKKMWLSQRGRRPCVIDKENNIIAVIRQADPLGIARSCGYYQPVVDTFSLELMRLIDEEYTRPLLYGSRKIATALRRKGYEVNRKRVQRLMRLMGIEAIYSGPNTS